MLIILQLIDDDGCYDQKLERKNKLAVLLGIQKEHTCKCLNKLNSYMGVLRKTVIGKAIIRKLSIIPSPKET